MPAPQPESIIGRHATLTALDYLHARPAFLLRRMLRIFTSLCEEFGLAGGLTPTQSDAMLAIGAAPSLDQIALSGLARIDDSTVTAIIDSLVKREFVERQTPAGDRRRRNLFLTMAGKRHLPLLKRATEKAEAALLSPLAALERSSYGTLLEKLARLGDDPPGPEPADDRKVRQALGPALSFRMRCALQIADGLFVEKTKSSGITPRQYALLFLVGSSVASDQATLARILGINRSSILVSNRALQAGGFVEAIADPQDGRRQMWRLTRQGDRLFRQLRPLQEESEREFLAVLARQKGEKFVSITRSLVAAHHGFSSISDHSHPLVD